MKIFSLQSKIISLIWSLILGTAINLIVNILTRSYQGGCGSALYCPIAHTLTYGWPMNVTAYGLVVNFWPSMIINSIFWAIVVFIVLSLVRYFKHKNKPLK